MIEVGGEVFKEFDWGRPDSNVDFPCLLITIDTEIGYSCKILCRRVPWVGQPEFNILERGGTRADIPDHLTVHSNNKPGIFVAKLYTVFFIQFYWYKDVVMSPGHRGGKKEIWSRISSC